MRRHSSWVVLSSAAFLVIALFPSFGLAQRSGQAIGPRSFRDRAYSGATYYRTQPSDDYEYGSVDTGRSPNSVEIQVRVPANAEIWFEQEKTSQTGSLRRFLSPPLEPGMEYTYDIRARWRDENGQQLERTRKLSICAGERHALNFFAARLGTAR